MKPAIVTALLIATAWAQQGPPAAEDGDAPDQGVARLSLLNGDAGIRHGDSGDETAAALNVPLLADDRVVTEQLVAAGRLLDIPVHDHVIVGRGRYSSFAEAGLL